MFFRRKKKREYSRREHTHIADWMGFDYFLQQFYHILDNNLKTYRSAFNIIQEYFTFGITFSRWHNVQHFVIQNVCERM